MIIKKAGSGLFLLLKPLTRVFLERLTQLLPCCANTVPTLACPAPFSLCVSSKHLGSPEVRTLCFHCQGCGVNPWPELERSPPLRGPPARLRLVGFSCSLWPAAPHRCLWCPPGLSGGGLSPWGQDGLRTDGRAERGRTPPTTLGPWTVWKGDRPCWPPVPGPEWPQQVCPGAPASGREAGLAGPLLIGSIEIQ